MKKLLVVGTIILLVWMSVSSTGINVKKSTVSYDGNTLYVGGSGPGNYTKIQDALDNSTNGDTVFVYSGTYNEQLNIYRSIKLIGEDKDTTFIDVSSPGKVASFIINSKGVYVCDFTIYDNDSGLIIINSDDNFIIGNNFERVNIDIGGENNIISNNKIIANKGETSIFIVNTNILIADNTISKGETGIYIVNGGYNNITISDNNFYNISWMGILVDGRVRQSNFIKNKFFNCDIGLEIHNSEDNAISGNIFKNNNLALNSFFSIRNNISGNAFIENKKGISLNWGSSINRIFQNNFIDNRINAHFLMKTFYNEWKGNFWDRPRTIPKIIVGNIGLLLPTWINIDWHPAREPYDIGV